MSSHLFLVDISYINQYVSREKRRMIKTIGFYLEQEISTLIETADFLDLFADGLECESSSGDIEFQKARLWYLRNLSLVLRGKNLNPKYDHIFAIEEIFQKYAFVIDYFVQLTTLCSQELDHRNLKKITEIIKDIIMFDIYLTESSESKYDLPLLLHEQICEEDPYTS